MLHFDTDYMEGAHPRVMETLVRTNLCQTPGYGSDSYTAMARSTVREALGEDSLDVDFLVGGTQTNSVVIDALLAHHEGVLACTSAHINVHESGAIECTGHKVLTLPSHEGKVTAGDVADYIDNFYADDTHEHMVAPGMVYISFPTEYGTLYTKREMEELHEVCRRADIPLYVDGARLGYGLAASEDITIKDMPKLCDVFYIGGTKVGALFGECVVSRKGLFRHFLPLVKQHGALLAKGRLLGIQFEELFRDGLYLDISAHAVRMAAILRQGFMEKGYRLAVDSPTNQQFFVLPNSVIDDLSTKATFEIWGSRGETESTVRFVTSWATKEEDVRQLLDILAM